VPHSQLRYPHLSPNRPSTGREVELVGDLFKHSHQVFIAWMKSQGLKVSTDQRLYRTISVSTIYCSTWNQSKNKRNYCHPLQLAKVATNKSQSSCAMPNEQFLEERYRLMIN
jgi:hypothetical protein